MIAALAVMVGLGFLAFLLLKKCQHTLSVVGGFILAMNLRPPMPAPQNLDLESDARGQKSKRLEPEEPSAPPAYDSVV